MVRQLLRMLKHISLAVLAIIATACIVEVGLRTHTIARECRSPDAELRLEPLPCPIAYARLAPLSEFVCATADTSEPVTVRTNQFGLRGEALTMPKPDEVLRVVCLGDDATLATDVAAESTFSVLVAQKLAEETGRPVEVVNAGLPGFCPLLSLAWARRNLAGLQPDLVILCCDISDVSDDQRVRPLARYSSDGTLQQVAHPAAVARPESVLQAIEQQFSLGKLLSEVLASRLSGISESGDPDEWEDAAATAGTATALQIKQTWEPIDPLALFCEEFGAEFVVAIVPSRTASAGTDHEVVRLLSEATEAYGIPYLDVTEDFPLEASPSLFLASGALSPAGHHLFADLLSWAIVHRDSGSVSEPYDGGSPITPAAAIVPGTATTDTAVPSVARPAPLPNPHRQRRSRP